MLICQNTAITKVAKALFKPFSFNQLQGTFISLQSQKKKKKRHCSGASIHQSIANLFGLTLLLSTLLYHAKGGEKDCCERLSTNVFCVVCACCSIFFFFFFFLLSFLTCFSLIVPKVKDATLWWTGQPHRRRQVCPCRLPFSA